ncbi:homing endonuclease [Vibrio phage vB_VpaM_R16F]|nr:homing endonuclease [Vibrio phage vB_VpaM_R16F]
MAKTRPLNELDFKIASLYKEGKRIFEIVKEINCELKEDAVRKSLIKQDLWKTSVCKATYDMDKLLNLHTNNEGWYLIGLLLADGSVSPTKISDTGKVYKKVIWEIDIKDVDSMIKIRDYFFPNSKLYYRKNRPLVSLNINKTELVDYLDRFGIQTNKREATMPCICQSLLKERDFALSFIAGYMDGDGCISINNTDGGSRLNVTAATPVWKEIKKVFDFVGFTYSEDTKHSTYVSCNFNNPVKSLSLLIECYNSTDLVFDRRKARLKDVITKTLQSEIRYSKYIESLRFADKTGYFLENVPKINKP